MFKYSNYPPDLQALAIERDLLGPASEEIKGLMQTTHYTKRQMWRQYPDLCERAYQEQFLETYERSMEFARNLLGKLR